MWTFESKRNALREQLLLAPETNPSEFVRRYLAQKQDTAQKLTAQKWMAGRVQPISALASRAQRLFAG